MMNLKSKKIILLAMVASIITDLGAGFCFASPSKARVAAENAEYEARGIAMEYYTDDDFANDRVPSNVIDRIIEPDSGNPSEADSD